MIIKATSSASSKKGFVIGTKPLEGFSSSQEGKAIAYLLLHNLPFGTVKHIYNNLHKAIEDQSFSEEDGYFQDMKKCAEELDQS
jgi:hypothetical protein